VESSLHRDKYFTGPIDYNYKIDNSIAFYSILNIPMPKAPLMGFSIWQQDYRRLSPQFTRHEDRTQDTRYTYSGPNNQKKNN